MKKRIITAVAIGVFFGAYFFVFSESVHAPLQKNVTESADTFTVNHAQSTIQSSLNDQHILSGIVVPHHQLMASRRAEFFHEVGSTYGNHPKPQTIILVSPNHYELGMGNVQTTNTSWQTRYGRIAANSAVIDRLVAQSVARGNSASFQNEHGIHNILDDIKTTFPDASLVPLILKARTSKEELASLEQTLDKQCIACLVVASVDFSHYQPALLGNLHDDVSLRGLQDADATMLLEKSETNSPASLALLALWAHDHASTHFSLFDHTNSGVIMKNPDSSETTTHIFGWYESGAPTTHAEKSVTFMMAGDMMFGRSVGALYANHFQDLFNQLGSRAFWGVDGALANCEGPISSMPITLDRSSHSMNFLFPPSSVQALSFLHINGVSIANNHAENNGAQGIATTRRMLQQEGIAAIGDPRFVHEDEVRYFQGEGMRIAVIGVDALIPQGSIVPLIKKLKQDPTTRVIIFPHWGVEYQKIHSPQQEQLADAWIDAGADLIVGAHPHVIQDIQVYKGVPIVYSLGNFVFDQLFSPDVQEGLIVAGKFTSTGLSLFFLPVHSHFMHPSFMVGVEKNQILSKVTSPLLQYEQETPAGILYTFPSQ